MAFYVVLWVIVMLLGVNYYFFNKLPSKKIFLLITFILSCIVGARDGFVGADTWHYIFFYDTGIAQDKETGMYEPLFMLIRHICYYLGFTHFVFFFILTFGSLYILYETTRKLRVQNYYLAFFIYFSIVFLSYQFNTIRMGVMASFVWLAFAYKVDKNDKKAVLMVLVAAGFHLVALAFIPILYIVDKEISQKKVMLFLVFAVLSVYLKLGERLIALFPILNEIDRLSGYIDVDEESSYGITLGTIVNMSLFLFMYLYDNTSYKNIIGHRIILNSLLFAIMIVCVFNSFHTIVTRIGQVMNLSLMYIWPLLISKIKYNPLKQAVVLFLCIYLWFYYSKGLEATSSLTQRLTLIPYVWDFNGIFR